MKQFEIILGRWLVWDVNIVHLLQPEADPEFGNVVARLHFRHVRSTSTIFLYISRTTAICIFSEWHHEMKISREFPKNGYCVPIQSISLVNETSLG